MSKGRAKLKEKGEGSGIGLAIFQRRPNQRGSVTCMYDMDKCSNDDCPLLAPFTGLG